MNIDFDLPLTGKELERTRLILGLSAREIAEMMERAGQKPATARGIYGLQTRSIVPFRCVAALTNHIGPRLFASALATAREQGRKEKIAREQAIAARQAKHGSS